MEGMILVHRHRLADDFLDIRQIRAFLVVAERDRHAGSAGPGGAADAVNIAFRLVRQVEIDERLLRERRPQRPPLTTY